MIKAAAMGVSAMEFTTMVSSASPSRSASTIASASGVPVTKLLAIGTLTSKATEAGGRA
ncbi:hypothetical protein HPQ61_04935 [Acetobacteraceae bacterium]|nr:hypothetical protein [Acetobacteraceae bacterium]